MDKKVLGKAIAIVAIIIIIIVIMIGLFLNINNKNNTISEEENNNINIEEYYGKRGNITEIERIKFLSKNDEYLVGMIGLEASSEVKNFSNTDMIRFALNIAVERYATMLNTKKNTDGSIDYIITESVVNKITEEFFGITDIEFDKKTDEFYSTSNKAFLFGENLGKTLYYYPVTQEKKDDGTIEIMVDAIFVSDEDEEVLEAAKYEGKYTQDNVDNTIKFIYSDLGKLISYQYL